MDMTVVGSGTLVPDAERVCACYFIAAGNQRILLDCGPGAVHHLARFALPWSAVSHVLLSHFHTDHSGDLPMLLFALKHGLAGPRTAPLAVLGPLGTAALFRKLADAFGSYMLDPGFPLTIRELAGGQTVELGDGVSLSAQATPHTATSLAFRIDAGDGSLGYTGDTGFDERLGRFLARVDLLLTECSLPDELAVETHLTPSRVAQLARLAAPRQLVLSHVYPQLDRGTLPARVAAAGWEGPVRVAEDGMRLRVGG